MDYVALHSIWQDTGNASKQWLLRFPLECEQRWPLDDGNPVVDWNAGLFASIDHEGPHLDFPCVVGAWHVMSDRLCRLLGDIAPGAIQFLAFRIRSIFGEEVPERYFVANYLQLLDVIDREYSRVLDDDWTQDETGDFCYLEQPVLNRRRIGPATVFRVYGQTELIVYREDVVAQIQSAGITGCVFKRIATVE